MENMMTLISLNLLLLMTFAIVIRRQVDRIEQKIDSILDGRETTNKKNDLCG